MNLNKLSKNKQIAVFAICMVSSVTILYSFFSYTNAKKEAAKNGATVEVVNPATANTLPNNAGPAISAQELRAIASPFALTPNGSTVDFPGGVGGGSGTATATGGAAPFGAPPIPGMPGFQSAGTGAANAAYANTMQLRAILQGGGRYVAVVAMGNETINVEVGSATPRGNVESISSEGATIGGTYYALQRGISQESDRAGSSGASNGSGAPAPIIPMGGK